MGWNLQQCLRGHTLAATTEQVYMYSTSVQRIALALISLCLTPTE